MRVTTALLLTLASGLHAFQCPGCQSGRLFAAGRPPFRIRGGTQTGTTLNTDSQPAPHRASTRADAEAEASAAASEQEQERQKFDSNVMKTYGRYPITMVKGEQCTLTDATGKKYLDFVAGISTCILGHAHPKLVKAVTEQIQQVHHVSNLYYIPNQGNLAEWLVSVSPADRVFFCNSGGEANEAAIKLTRKYANTMLGLEDAGKVPVIVTAHSSFHGRTLGAMTATGQPKYQKHFTPLVPGFEYVTYNDPEGLKALVAEISASEDRALAGIMLETLQGEGGIRPATPEFMQTARKLCDDHNALLICDEVQVGMGRSGKMWGFEQLDIVPDVFTTAKALGGGVPIGAMLCRKHCDVFAPGDHATTYGGNPLACAAGMAVAQAFSEENLLENVQARGDQLRSGLNDLIAKYPTLLKEVRGWGLINGVELQESAGVLASEVVGKAISEGLLLVPAGTHVVRFVPPLIVGEDDVREALEIFERACAALDST